MQENVRQDNTHLITCASASLMNTRHIRESAHSHTHLITCASASLMNTRHIRESAHTGTLTHLITCASASLMNIHRHETAHTYTHTHTCARGRALTHTHACMHALAHRDTSTRTLVCTHAHTHTPDHMCFTNEHIIDVNLLSLSHTHTDRTTNGQETHTRDGVLTFYPTRQIFLPRLTAHARINIASLFLR